MSCDNWKLEKDLCRCCHAEGSFINLNLRCEDPQETYTDMLRDSLEIILTPVVGVLAEVTYKICEACILRLRDASNFKKQIIVCEERFKDMYSRNFIKIADSDFNAEVKEEIPDSDPEDLKEEYSNANAGVDDDDEGFNLIQLGAGCLDAADDETHDDRNGLEIVDIKLERKTRGRRKAKNPSVKKTKSEKKVGRPRKTIKEEEETKPIASAKQEKPKRGGAPKFRLRDGDYRREGDAYHCSRCDKRYDKIFSLRFHVKTKHYKIPRYICQYCSKEFMTLAPMTVHKLEEHNIDERFKCKACNCTFNTKVQLRKHINNFHMLGEKYKCEFCEYESFSFEGMYKHKFKHKTVKDYHCRFCRKSFLRKTTLDLHERIHTGDRRKVCKVCGQAFVQKASLNYHMTKYHPEVNF